jgi:peptide deformylase
MVITKRFIKLVTPKDNMEYRLLNRWDKRLREKCAEVKDFSDLDKLLEEMHSFIKNFDDYGISAPQIGDNRRIMIAKKSKNKIIEMINPILLQENGYKLTLEGCMNVPRSLAVKLRRKEVGVIFQDRKGKYNFETFRGYYAAGIQHDLAHLDGKVMEDFDTILQKSIDFIYNGYQGTVNALKSLVPKIKYS